MTKIKQKIKKRRGKEREGKKNYKSLKVTKLMASEISKLQRYIYMQERLEIRTWSPDGTTQANFRLPSEARTTQAGPSCYVPVGTYGGTQPQVQLTQ